MPFLLPVFSLYHISSFAATKGVLTHCYVAIILVIFIFGFAAELLLPPHPHTPRHKVDFVGESEAKYFA
jgi:hypothetical protein